MKWFYNLKITTKLVMGFMIVALIAGAVGGVGILSIRDMNKANTLLYEENTLGIEYMGNASYQYQGMRVNILKTMSEITKSKYIDELNTQMSNVDSYLKKYEDGIISEEDRALFDQMEPLWNSYKSLAQDAINLVQAGKMEEAHTFIYGEVANTGAALQKTFDKMMAYNSAAAKARSDKNIEKTNRDTLIMTIVIICGVIIAIILGLFIAWSISKPIRKLVEAADKLALGDVNVNVQATSKDEVGILMNSFGKMIENIRAQALVAESLAAGDLTVQVKVQSENDLLGKKFAEIVDKNNVMLHNIVSAAEQVALGAKQISDSSIVLSQGATEQASSIEELTASVEEISAQTQKNAENANEARNLTQEMKDDADQGHHQMNEMLKAMEEINISSENISSIIKVIDEIAFQTNILALNAAIEAARAGQHGRGFAVVAEEVRNLAARSANAAKETTKLIEGSIKKAAGGMKLAKETALALNKIVEDVTKTANLVNDIAIASGEQATGINQINQGLMLVSQVVQTNSATAEEGAAASEELTSQAELLKQQVGNFKLKEVVNLAHQEFDELSPEVQKLLDDLSEKKIIKEKENKEAPEVEAFEEKTTEEEFLEEKTLEEAAPTKEQIALSDQEFGKY
ncbi:MAG: methyl-accepting chemotaxis protein [Bacillota bacterium]|jgi:methyl-accepting chemotaxis protein